MPAIVITAVAELLEPQHYSNALLDAAVVLLNQVIEVFRRTQFGVPRQRTVGFQLTHRTVRCSVPVQRDRLRWTPLTLDRLAEESLGGSDVAPGAQPEIDCPARPVHGTI